MKYRIKYSSVRDELDKYIIDVIVQRAGTNIDDYHHVLRELCNATLRLADGRMYLEFNNEVDVILFKLKFGGESIVK